MTEPMTLEQLDLIHDETQHAVTKALKYYTRRALIAWLILVAGVGYAVGNNRHTFQTADTHIVSSTKQAVRIGCRRDQRSQASLRLILSKEITFLRKTMPETHLTNARIRLLKANKKLIFNPDCAAAESTIKKP